MTDLASLVQIYDDAKEGHVPAVQNEQAAAASAGGHIQLLSGADIKKGFCSSWEADKAALNGAMFLINLLFPAAAVAIKGLEAVGDSLHAQVCAKPTA